MKIIRIAVMAVILIAMALCIVFANAIEKEKNLDMANRVEFQQYKPNLPLTSAKETEIDEPPRVVNQGIQDLRESYPDVVGWITLPSTAVDYPFVQSGDNDYYLNRDYAGQESKNGAIFLDSRSNKDFSDFNTVIYGHHMKSGAMFATLGRFGSKDFFEGNQTGFIFLTYETYTLEIFAYAVIKPDDAFIYGATLEEVHGIQEYTDYVKQKARHYREINLTGSDRVVTLSTCNYEFKNARAVVLARICV